MKELITQNQLLKEFYQNNPNRNIKHPEVVDWVSKEYLKRTGKVFRDPDRGIRKLAQQGFLIKIAKGIYKFDPDHIKQKQLADFNQSQKEIIFKRDGYRCVICGLGKENGIELHADHIKPKELGGKATIENGQTLCASHNFQKKHLKQTETGKKMFIRLYELAKKNKNQSLIDFCSEILKTYEIHNINGHIEWKK